MYAIYSRNVSRALNLDHLLTLLIHFISIWVENGHRKFALFAIKFNLRKIQFSTSQHLGETYNRL